LPRQDIDRRARVAPRGLRGAAGDGPTRAGMLDRPIRQVIVPP
jgi:hypothetical protein